MRFGFLMYPGFEELDLIGPWEMATMWHAYAGGPECVTVAARAGAVRCAKGLVCEAQFGYDDCPPLDYLLVPGGFAAFDHLHDDALLGFVARHGDAGRHVLSVCSGAFLLKAAGLLQGRRVATHWKAAARLREAGGCEVVDARYVRDGHVWSSAGVSAGIDLLLHFIAEVGGPAAAASVQLNAEYFPDSLLYGSLRDEPVLPAYARIAASAQTPRADGTPPRRADPRS